MSARGIMFGQRLLRIGSLSALVIVAASMLGCSGGGGNDISGTLDDGQKTISVTVSGLTGTSLILQNNGGDNLATSANGSFTFTIKLDKGSSYTVTVFQQPAGQRCQVDNGSGIVGDIPITNVTVTCSAISSVVTPLYPANGADWNDYVKDDGATLLTASDQACAGGACLHGGELRVWRPPQIASCAGLVVGDALGAFDWTCDDRSGSAAFISTGLKAGKRLSDLIDFDNRVWLDNQVVISGAASLTTPAGKWWARPIELANSGGDLGLPRVYIVTANPRTHYALTADKAALVVRPGIVLKGPGSGESVVTTGFTRQLWIEGLVDGAGATYGIHFQQAENSAVRGVDVKNAQIGLAINWSNHNRFTDIRVHENTGDGIHLGNLAGSAQNVFTDVVAIHNGGDGLRIGGNPRTSPSNVVRRVLAANNGKAGVMVVQQPQTRLEGVTAFANADGGVGVFMSASTWLSDVTAANNDGGGITASGENVTLQDVAAANNSGSGIGLSAGSFSVVGVATVGNGNFGVFMSSASSTFSGVLKVGGNAGGDCSIGLGSTGLTSSCANNGGSDAVLTTGASVSSSFVGKVGADDPHNASDTNGAAAFGAITDWINFALPHRGWGNDGTAFLDASNRDRCTGGTCRIWDWSLRGSDSVLRATASLPTGNDIVVHRWPAADQSSCQAIAGASWDGSRCLSTALRSAVELIGDGMGNDNGLCESGETCLFTPDLGSYQGHGPLVNAGPFVNGTLSGIALLRHAGNGY